MIDQNKGCATAFVSMSKGLFRPGAPTSCPTHEHLFNAYINKMSSNTVVATLPIWNRYSFSIKPTIS